MSIMSLGLSKGLKRSDRLLLRRLVQ